MKKIYIGFNILLVLIIFTLMFVKPEVFGTSMDEISKSLTTSVFTGVQSTKKEEDVSVNPVLKVVDDIEERITEKLVPGAVLTDVLETQVGTMSAYGLDCEGCSGVVGARYDVAGNNVRYYDPTYGEMRIVAGDKKYPYGTVVRVVDSKIGTFYAIVLDRGGDIGIGRRYMFDLLFYTEAEAYGFGLSRNTTFEIVRYGY